jgi:IS30 family transposase
MVMDSHHHTKLKASERDLIAIWKGAGVSLREIARRLGRSHSTIVEEVGNNSFKDSLGQKYYVAIHAQAKADRRKVEARKRQPLKSSRTYSYVLEHLRMGWSPEQIAGRLKKENGGRSVICCETIYQFIYASSNKDKRLWEYLPWKRPKRKKKHGRKVYRSHIPDRVSIRQRPYLVDQRRQFGHWEGDTIEGKGHKDGIHTQVERLSRKMLAKIVEQISSEVVSSAQEEMFSPLPNKARRSTTLDNGRENHLHTRLKSLGMQAYFADPYSAWQRGTNEYHNGLLRRYLPKGTSFADLTQEELDDIVWEINNRPRKVLNFNTPEEVFNSYLTGRITT